MKYPMIRLSHSSADRFDTCPYAYEREKLIKDVPYTETTATKWGQRCHTGVENFINGESDELTTLMMDDLRPTLDYVKNFECDHKGVEVEWAFNTSGQICEFNDPAAMYGGYTDFEAVRGDKAWVVDWKSGSRHTKYEQVELYALTVWMRFPEVNQINAGYVWLKHRNPNEFLSFKTLYRATDMQRIWEYRVNQWKRIYAAHDTGVFQAKPGKGRAGYPCGWCGANVGGKCDFSNTEYKAK